MTNIFSIKRDFLFDFSHLEDNDKDKDKDFSHLEEKDKLRMDEKLRRRNNQSSGKVKPDQDDFPP